MAYLAALINLFISTIVALFPALISLFSEIILIILIPLFNVMLMPERGLYRAQFVGDPKMIHPVVNL